MVYKYSGYLATLLDAPDPGIRDELDAVVFTAEDLMQWDTEEQEVQREWEHIPVRRTLSGKAVRLEGQFEGIRRLDIASDELRFWVSLGTSSKEDARFPVDVRRYPIVEVTYRCPDDQAKPSWLWSYPGGVHFAALAPTREWLTLARRIPHGGVPKQVDALTFRLYATRPHTKTLDIESVRFRAMSPAEADATARDQVRLDACASFPQFPILDQFLPLGTFMNAGVAGRSAETLGLSFEEYWTLLFQDIAKHHHNAIALENAELLTPGQLDTLFELAGSCKVKVMPMHSVRLDESGEGMQEFIDTRVKPHAGSDSVLAWNVYVMPSERSFGDLVNARQQIEQVDRNHPMALLMERPDAFALYAPHFPASGIAHYASHAPWTVAHMLQQHLPLSRGQQFWLVAPGFMFPSDTPDWSGCPEMRGMMNLAFANGIKGWFSYSYHSDPPWVSGSCRRSLTGPFLMFSDLWSELGLRINRFNALAPLFLEAKPELTLQKWFASTSTIHARLALPEDIPAATVHRLRGPEFNIYYVVSNDTTEMTTENIDISPRSARGLEFYDLADFVNDRVWIPMPRTRHLEMFPGQAHIILAAKPAVCARWRDAIAAQLVEDDQRQLVIELLLARQYSIKLDEVEAMANSVGSGDIMADLATMKRARDMLLDLTYATPALCDARGSLIETRAALSGCDISLCALLGRGRVDQAAVLGIEIVPLARELARLRLEFRSGRGAKVLPQCKDLAKRTLAVLTRIRGVSLRAV